MPAATRKLAKRPARPASNDPGQYLPLLAKAAAERVKASAEPLSRSEALAVAPWHADMPAAWESAFRKAYADQLESRGLALPAKRSGSRGASGESALARRTFRATKQEFAEHDARAKAAGVAWATWVRRKLSEK